MSSASTSLWVTHRMAAGTVWWILTLRARQPLTSSAAPPVPRHPEDDDVGLHGGQVELHAGQPAHALGEPAAWRGPRRAGPPASSATRPAAASTPAWRMPPPSILRTRRARAMKSREPHTSEPTGAPRPLDRQNVTESTAARSRPPAARRDHGIEEARAVEVHRRRRRGPRRPPRRSPRACSRCRRGGCACSRGRPGPSPGGGCWRAGSPPAPARASGSRRGLDRHGSARRRRRRAPAHLVIEDVGVGVEHDFLAGRASGRARRPDCPACPRARTAPPPCPARRAAVASRRWTVGSSSQTSSPTSARAMASRIAGVGRVRVSERRSTTSCTATSLRLRRRWAARRPHSV